MLKDNQIIEEKERRLFELGQFELSFPFQNVNLLEKLRELPRTGKLVRFARLPFKLRTRSVFDHICSLFDIASVILPYYNGINVTNLSYLIAYHDINEVLLGDIPQYTETFPKEYNHVWTRLKKINKQERECIVNEFLGLYADNAQRYGLNILKDNKNEKTLLYFLDAIDPIVSIWRYIFQYRAKFDEKRFVEAMMDFFENPNTVKMAHKCNIGPLRELLLVLIDKKKAVYYGSGCNITDICDNKHSCDIFEYIVEKAPLFN